MIVQCCSCKRVRKGKEWVDSTESEVLTGHVSHGYCPSCAAEAFAEIRQLTDAEGLAPTRVATS